MSVRSAKDRVADAIAVGGLTVQEIATRAGVAMNFAHGATRTALRNGAATMFNGRWYAARHHQTRAGRWALAEIDGGRGEAPTKRQPPVLRLLDGGMAKKFWRPQIQHREPAA